MSYFLSSDERIEFVLVYNVVVVVTHSAAWWSPDAQVIMLVLHPTHLSFHCCGIPCVATNTAK